MEINKKRRVFLIHDLISIGLILCLCLYLCLIWSNIPDIIPIHYHGSDPDSFGSKWNLLILLPFPVLMFLLGYFLRKYAHKLPYQGKQLGDDPEALWKEQVKISWAFLVSVFLLSVIAFAIFQASLPKAQQTDHLQYVFLGILTVGVCLYILFLIFRGKRQRL